MTKIGSAAYDQTLHQRSGTTSRPKDRPSGDAWPSMQPQTIRVEDVQALDMSLLKPIRIAELPTEEYNAMIERDLRFLEAKYQVTPEPIRPERHAGSDLYATVGSIEIDNSGGVMIPDDELARRIHREIYDAGIIPADLEGPRLAAEMAKQIARLLGATVSKARTALTQADYARLPVFKQPESRIDREAMRADPFFAMLEKVIAERKEYIARVAHPS